MSVRSPCLPDVTFGNELLESCGEPPAIMPTLPTLPTLPLWSEAGLAKGTPTPPPPPPAPCGVRGGVGFPGTGLC